MSSLVYAPGLNQGRAASNGTNASPPNPSNHEGDVRINVYGPADDASAAHMEVYADDIGGFSDTDDGIQLPELCDEDPLAKILRDNKESGMDKTQQYWTECVLRHIITEKRVRGEFQRRNIKCPMSIQKLLREYLRIFAILLLLDRVADLEDFSVKEVNDDALPLAQCSKTRILYSSKAAEKTLQCVEGWPECIKEYCIVLQRSVMIPFFSLGENFTCKEYRLRDTCIFPWKHDENNRIVDYGAFASVRHVKMHSTSHAFHGLLRRVNLRGDAFAIKTLRQQDNNEVEFRKELKHLKRFGGHSNKHLVIALAAFRHQQKWSFIFPKADCDLSKRMEKQPPSYSWETFKWAAEQLCGLIKALNAIHNPAHLDVTAEPTFGRHGDLKCDNILCFGSNESFNETLVIADFGLSATNRLQSRSNIPNKTVPPVPGYRPPECDIKDGTISRAFDVWTMGCLYLDFITWVLGGPGLLLEFRVFRTTPYITGSRQDIFFEFRTQEQIGYVVQVKSEVKQWIRRLRDHPKCSQMVQEMLTVIESRMLIVQAEGRQRAQSSELWREFLRIYSKCDTQSYCMDQGEIPQDEQGQDEPVLAELNDTAQALINEHHPTLHRHTGSASRPLSSGRQENPDVLV